MSSNGRNFHEGIKAGGSTSQNKNLCGGICKRKGHLWYVYRNLFCHLPHANFECGHWKSCIVFPLCGLCLFDKNLEKYSQNCRAGRHTICAPLRLYFRISEARHGATFFPVRDGAMTWLVYVLNALYNIFVFFYQSTTFYRKENSICTNLEWEK